MASRRLSSEIEGAKNRPSPVQQRSRIPVRIVNRLNNNSGKSSSSKDEVNMNQRILNIRLEKNQNNPPSRIPIPIGRTNSKDVGRDKIPKTVITAIGKRPVGTNSGINLPQTSGHQAVSINDGTAKRLTVTKRHSSPEHATKPTLPVTRRTPTKQVPLLDTEQISTDEKNAGTKNTKVQGDSVQTTDFVPACKANQKQTEDNIKTDNNPCGVFSISCEEDHKKELDRIEKEHSAIVEELQQWVEDGDKKNKMLEEIIQTTNEENERLLVKISVMKKELKALESENRTLQTQLETKSVDAKTMLERNNEVSASQSYDEKHKKELAQLEKEHSEIEQELQKWIEDGDKKIKDLEEIIETTNEENVKLLVQISVMKKELKALEKENNTLQTELKTKRTDVKNLRAKEHYNERELRNLKRDLKRKEQSLQNARVEKQKLLNDTDNLEGMLRDNQASNEQLNVQINELKGMVKEANERPVYGHLREEVELLKGSLDMCFHKEKLIDIQVEALTAEASHFKACDETSALLEQLEGQLDLCMKENARIMSEKDKELNELKDAKSKVIDDLNDQLAKLTNNHARKISDKEKEFKELIDEKSRFIERLENQLTQFENRNATIVSEKNKELNELNRQHSRDDIQLRDQLVMLMKDHARIVSENGKMMNKLGEKSRVIEALEDQLAKLKNENARVILDKNKEKMELNKKNARFIDQLEEQLAKLMRENSSELSEISNNDKKMTELQEQVQKLREQKTLILSELNMMYHSLNYNDTVIEKLIKDLEHEMLEKDALSTALEFSLDICAIKEKEHARETRNLKYQLQEMTFLLNIMDSCSDVNESKHQVCECREKFFAM